jgi:DNA-binding transcriptional regulator YhcF (GntR family)
MAKLINLIPKKNIVVKESIDDLDTTLPQAVNRYLEKMVSQIKGMNLNRKKEILVLAKVIDAMGMDKNELMRYIQKIKKNDILNK